MHEVSDKLLSVAPPSNVHSNNNVSTGKLKQEDLSSVGRFFSRGATLEKATAFTKSAVAFERNASLAGISNRPSQRLRPNTIADELGESN